MIDLRQFRNLVIRPALMEIDAFSVAAERLVLGTALVESNLQYIHQLGGGPAKGLFQCEPTTHDDIWENYLRYKVDLMNKLRGLMIPRMDMVDQLHGNHFYAAAICRIHYMRVKKALPQPNDALGMASYHKKYYNSVLGATDPAESVVHFQTAIDLL